jgi:hypothetical protein
MYSHGRILLPGRYLDKRSYLGSGAAGRALYYDLDAGHAPSKKLAYLARKRVA